MLHYEVSRSFGLPVLEKKIFKSLFLPYMGMGDVLVM